MSKKHTQGLSSKGYVTPQAIYSNRYYMGFCFTVMSTKKKHFRKNNFQELSCKKHIVCIVLKKQSPQNIVTFYQYYQINLKDHRKPIDLKGKSFLQKTIFIFCKQLLPLVSFVFPKQVTTALYSSGTTEGHRLIKVQAVCTILFRAVSFSVPSPFDNK